MQQLNGQNFTYSSFKVFAVLLFILGIIFLLSYFMRKINKQNGGFLNSNLIRIIARYPLGERRYLYIVKINQETLLLGITPQSINYIKEIDLPEEKLKGKSKQETENFIDILKGKFKEIKNTKK